MVCIRHANGEVYADVLYPRCVGGVAVTATVTMNGSSALVPRYECQATGT